MQIKLNLIASVCENMGIGINGDLPCRLKKEMAYFVKMTTMTNDSNKKNIVLMGRKTWESIPKKFRPLKDRINMVLTTQSIDLGDNVIACKSLSDAIDKMNRAPLKNEVEQIWVIGGSSVYKTAMESPYFHRLYLTRVKKDFKCDTFFPDLPEKIALVKDPNVPDGVQEENGIEFEYQVFEKQC